MQGACDQFFTRACLTREQSIAEVRRNPPHACKHFAHERAPADHALKAVGVKEFVLQGFSLSPRARNSDKATNPFLEPLDR